MINISHYSRESLSDA